MKQILNKSEAKLVARILRVVSGRLDPIREDGMWVSDDDKAEMFREADTTGRLFLTMAESRTLARVIGAKPTDPAPLTPREEGLLKEIRKFLAHLDGIPAIEEIESWQERFREIADKMEGKWR